MSTHEFEPTPYKEISPVGRYFNDLKWKGDSFINMRLALDTLVEESGMSMTGLEMDALVGELMPLYGDPNIDPSDIRDAFTVLPLAVVAPYIDATVNLRDVVKWYEQVLPNIKKRARAEHSSDCLDSVSFTFNNSCAHSSVCPMIYTAKYLEADLFETDFTSSAYENDRIMTFDLAQRKEMLAVEHGFRTRSQANGMMEAYRDAFWERFQDATD